MLTPKQQALLTRLTDILAPLGAEVEKPSLEYRTNQAISQRVNGWLQDLQKGTAKPRTVLQTTSTSSDTEIVAPGACIEAVRSPFFLDPTDLRDLEAKHGPKSTWKYPLNWTPW